MNEFSQNIIYEGTQMNLNNQVSSGISPKVGYANDLESISFGSFASRQSTGDGSLSYGSFLNYKEPKKECCGSKKRNIFLNNSSGTSEILEYGDKPCCDGCSDKAKEQTRTKHNTNEFKDFNPKPKMQLENEIFEEKPESLFNKKKKVSFKDGFLFLNLGNGKIRNTETVIDRNVLEFGGKSEERRYLSESRVTNSNRAIVNVRHKPTNRLIWSIEYEFDHNTIKVNGAGETIEHNIGSELLNGERNGIALGFNIPTISNFTSTFLLMEKKGIGIRRDHKDGNGDEDKGDDGVAPNVGKGGWVGTYYPNDIRIWYLETPIGSREAIDRYSEEINRRINRPREHKPFIDEPCTDNYIRDENGELIYRDKDGNIVTDGSGFPDRILDYPENVELNEQTGEHPCCERTDGMYQVPLDMECTNDNPVASFEKDGYWDVKEVYSRYDCIKPFSVNIFDCCFEHDRALWCATTPEESIDIDWAVVDCNSDKVFKELKKNIKWDCVLIEALKGALLTYLFGLKGALAFLLGKGSWAYQEYLYAEGQKDEAFEELINNRLDEANYYNNYPVFNDEGEQMFLEKDHSDSCLCTPGGRHTVVCSLVGSPCRDLCAEQGIAQNCDECEIECAFITDQNGFPVFDPENSRARNVTQGNNNLENCCESHLNLDCSCACDGFIETFLDKYGRNKNSKYLEMIVRLRHFEDYYAFVFNKEKQEFYRENYPDCYNKAVKALEKQYNEDAKKLIDNHITSSHNSIVGVQLF